MLGDVEVYDVEAVLGAGTHERIYGDAFADPSQWRALSPVTYVGTNRHPPAFIAYSQVRGHAEAAKSSGAKLKAAGTRVSLYDGRAYSHFEMGCGFGSEEREMTGRRWRF